MFRMEKSDILKLTSNSNNDFILRNHFVLVSVADIILLNNTLIKLFLRQVENIINIALSMNRLRNTNTIILDKAGF